MLIPSSEGSALGVALLSMACWGSWSNFLVLTNNHMRFEIFYIVFSIATFLVATCLALTLGMMQSDGHHGQRTFLHDDFNGIGHDRYVYALLAGTLFNVANLLLCKGIAMLGLALAFPLCIGTAMVLGTVLTYIVSPSGNPLLLFFGVLVAFSAVCVAAVMHREKDKQQGNGSRQGSADSSLVSGSTRSTGPTMIRKLCVCIVGGVLMGMWSPLTASAEKEPGLTPYGEFFFFTLAVVLSSMLLVPAMVVCPIEGGSGDSVGMLWEELRRTPCIYMLFGLLGGMVWAVGTVANAIAGASGILNSAAAYAIGQCANVAAIFWGVLVFKEFQGTDARVKRLIVAVLALYGCAIVMIAAAAN
eukprot:TRINITY_DN23077_c0_g1_i2.p1 TRINITY_DN23077_c0_g1~~TRINITY_DN23077_c0_g1_i2.p1  ORF type:complete len:375 (-),score=38.18 TRINITY_DN23077_c0_g1_i2:409-1485(-)